MRELQKDLLKIYNTNNRVELLRISSSYFNEDLSYHDAVYKLCDKFKDIFKDITHNNMSVAECVRYDIMLGRNEVDTVAGITPLILFSFLKLIHIDKNNNNAEIPGNYSYSVTIGDGVEEINKFREIMYSTDEVLGSIVYSPDSDEFLITLLLYSLIKIGPEEKEKLEVVIDGYFILEIDNTGEELEYAITPDGAMKRLIKNDALLEDSKDEL